MASSAFHNQDLMNSMVTVLSICQTDIANYNFDRFQACYNFVKSFEKHMLAIEQENKADFITIRGY